MANWIEEPKDVQTSAPTENETQVQANQRVADLSTPKIPEPIVPETPEPVVVKPTIAPEVTVEPTKVEETTVIEPIKAEPIVEPIKQPTGKVETAQDIKAKETANKASEEALNEQNKIVKTEEFSKMIQSGATIEEMGKFANDNPQFKQSFGVALKENLKSVDNVKYFGKYSTMTNEQLQAEVNAWNIVPWSERFNLLPENQRLAFKQFQNVNESVNINEKTDFSSWDKAQSVNELVQGMQGLFSTDHRKKYKEMLNSPEFLSLNSKLSDKRAEISKFDIEMEDQEENIREEMAWNLPWSINAAVRDANRDSVKEKRLLLAEYSALQGEFSNLKDNAELELEFVKYEDQQARQTYMTALGLYETRRKESLNATQTKEQRDFILQTKVQAEERQRAFTLEMKEVDQRFKDKNQKGVYQTDREGNLLYLTNWEAVSVKTSDWEIVWTTQTKKYSENIIKNNDWTFSVLRTFNDWRKPEVFSYWTDGKSSLNTSLGVYDSIANIDEKPWRFFGWKEGLLQCGEAANRYLKNAGITDIRVWDSYESKRKWVNNQWPQVGWLAVWNPNKEGKFWEFGHIGMVTWYNENSWMVEITDWNKNWDGVKNTYTIPVSQVNNSDWGFVHLEWGKSTEIDTSWFKESNVPLYKEFLKKWSLTAGTLKTIDDFDEFKEQALSYQKNLTKQWTPQISKLIEIATDLRDKSPSRTRRIAAWTKAGQFASSELSDYQANFDAFISNNALDQLINLKAAGATFGALSERELDFIQSSATSLRANMSDEKFKSELNRIIDTLSSWLWEFNKPQAVKIESSSVDSLLNDYNSYNTTWEGSSTTKTDYSNTLWF